MLNEMTPKIKAVQKMQDCIAAHQTEEINLSDLANTAYKANYSSEDFALSEKSLYKISDCHFGM